jgi:hypothetical protein
VGGASHQDTDQRDQSSWRKRLVRANKNPVTEKLKARTQAAANKTFMEAARAFDRLLAKIEQALAPEVMR